MIGNPTELWEKYKDRMSDNYFFELRRSLPNPELELPPNQIQLMYQRALGDIERRLEATGHHLSDYPTMPHDFINSFDGLPALQALAIVERNEYREGEQRQVLENLLPTLNPEQHHAFEEITAAIDDTTYDGTTGGRLFLVNGPGGSGKSQLRLCLAMYAATTKLLSQWHHQGLQQSFCLAGVLHIAVSRYQSMLMNRLHAPFLQVVLMHISFGKLPLSFGMKLLCAANSISKP